MIEFEKEFRSHSLVQFAPRYKMTQKGKYAFRQGKRDKGCFDSLYFKMQGQDEFLTTQSLLLALR